MNSTLKAGRVILDGEGIRLKKVLGLFGDAFFVPWSSVTGWAFGADVVTSRGAPKGQVVQWVIEIDHHGRTDVLRLDPNSDASRAVVAELEARLPAERPPRIGRVHSARLPPAMAKLVGPDHDDEDAVEPSREGGWEP